MDLVSSRYSSSLLSIQADSAFQQFNVQNESDDKLKISRIMSISRKSTDNTNEDKDHGPLKKHRRHYVMNQLSDFQSDIIHANKIKVDSSAPFLPNTIKCKKKNKLAVVLSKSSHRQKLIHKKQICIRPAWVSPNKNPTTNSDVINRPINRMPFSLKQLRDPCQVLELYTRFKRIDCISNECVCRPLPSCCDISSYSFIKNAQICSVYLMHNNKI